MSATTIKSQQQPQKWQQRQHKNNLDFTLAPMLSGFQRSNIWKMPYLKNSDDHSSSGTLSLCYCHASGVMNILYGYNIERGSGKGADMKTLVAQCFPLNSKHFKNRNIMRHAYTVYIVHFTVNIAHCILIPSIKELLSDPDLIIA